MSLLMLLLLAVALLCYFFLLSFAAKPPFNVDPTTIRILQILGVVVAAIWVMEQLGVFRLLSEVRI
jgi:heme/copper-type cytochrome/quinol oxidase subunit 4